MTSKMFSERDTRRTVFFLGRAVIFALLVAAAILSGRFTDFMNAYGLVFVFLGGVALSLMSFDVQEIVTALKDTGRPFQPTVKTRKSIIYWESASRNFWMVGVLATLVAFVVALTTSEGGIQGITTRMATSLIPTLYGAILSVICLVCALKLSTQSQLRHLEGANEGNDKTSFSLDFVNIVGYVLFVAIIAGTLIKADINATEPIFTAWGWVIHWPSLLIVLGGTVALVLFVGTGAGGQTLTLGFAVTGFIGSLMGCIQVLLGFSARNIEEIAAAMTFVLSSCFFALLGMMLVGAPLEDRTIKGSADASHSTSSRVAWYVFPLVTLILIVVTFVLVITPMKVPE
jgi:flagellar motor component MotA